MPRTREGRGTPPVPEVMIEPDALDTNLPEQTTRDTGSEPEVWSIPLAELSIPEQISFSKKTKQKGEEVDTRNTAAIWGSVAHNFRSGGLLNGIFKWVKQNESNLASLWYALGAIYQNSNSHPKGQSLNRSMAEICRRQAAKAEGQATLQSALISAAEQFSAKAESLAPDQPDEEVEALEPGGPPSVSESGAEDFLEDGTTPVDQEPVPVELEIASPEVVGETLDSPPEVVEEVVIAAETVDPKVTEDARDALVIKVEEVIEETGASSSDAEEALRALMAGEYVLVPDTILQAAADPALREFSEEFRGGLSAELREQLSLARTEATSPKSLPETPEKIGINRAGGPWRPVEKFGVPAAEFVSTFLIAATVYFVLNGYKAEKLAGMNLGETQQFMAAMGVMLASLTSGLAIHETVKSGVRRAIRTGKSISKAPFVFFALTTALGAENVRGAMGEVGSNKELAEQVKAELEDTATQLETINASVETFKTGVKAKIDAFVKAEAKSASGADDRGPKYVTWKLFVTGGEDGMAPHLEQKEQYQNKRDELVSKVKDIRDKRGLLEGESFEGFVGRKMEKFTEEVTAIQAKIDKLGEIIVALDNVDTVDLTLAHLADGAVMTHEQVIETFGPDAHTLETEVDSVVESLKKLEEGKAAIVADILAFLNEDAAEVAKLVGQEEPDKAEIALETGIGDKTNAEGEVIAKGSITKIREALKAPIDRWQHIANFAEANLPSVMHFDPNSGLDKWRFRGELVAFYGILVDLNITIFSWMYARRDRRKILEAVPEKLKEVSETEDQIFEALLPIVTRLQAYSLVNTGQTAEGGRNFDPELIAEWLRVALTEAAQAQGQEKDEAHKKAGWMGRLREHLKPAQPEEAKQVDEVYVDFLRGHLKELKSDNPARRQAALRDLLNQILPSFGHRLEQSLVPGDAEQTREKFTQAIDESTRPLLESQANFLLNRAAALRQELEQLSEQSDLASNKEDKPTQVRIPLEAGEPVAVTDGEIQLLIASARIQDDLRKTQTMLVGLRQQGLKLRDLDGQNKNRPQYEAAPAYGTPRAARIALERTWATREEADEAEVAAHRELLDSLASEVLPVLEQTAQESGLLTDEQELSFDILPMRGGLNFRAVLRQEGAIVGAVTCPKNLPAESGHPATKRKYAQEVADWFKASGLAEIRVRQLRHAQEKLVHQLRSELFVGDLQDGQATLAGLRKPSEAPDADKIVHYTLANALLKRQTKELAESMAKKKPIKIHEIIAYTEQGVTIPELNSLATAFKEIAELRPEQLGPWRITYDIDDMAFKIIPDVGLVKNVARMARRQETQETITIPVSSYKGIETILRRLEG